MSDIEAWDADDFEPELPSRPARTFDDKWEGEDEEDDAPKDNWEDSEEEEAKPAKPTTESSQAYQRPKKKPLAERLAEKQAQKEKEKEDKEKKEKEEKREITAEERLAERIKLQKIQENDSLNLARGLFGTGEQEQSSIDQMFPTTEEDFKQFSTALKTKLGLFEDSPHYQAFASKLVCDLVVGLGVEDVKKLGVQINSLYHEKERQRKETEKKKKKKSKATIKVDRADDFDLISDATGGGGAYDDDDDFI